MCIILQKKKKKRKETILGAPEWFSQLGNRLLVLARVMISWFVGSSPTSGSKLMVWSLLEILSLSLSLSFCPSSACSLSLSQDKELSIKKKTSFMFVSITKI